MSVTIQGYSFDVPPDPAVAEAAIPDEWKHSLQQTRIENIRNNMAARIKKMLNGSEQLTDEQLAQATKEVQEYAAEYKFGQRARGTGPRVVDPVEREMIKLAKDDISAAYRARHNERIPTEALNAAVEKLLEVKHDEYASRARRNLRDREKAGADVLAAAGV